MKRVVYYFGVSFALLSAGLIMRPVVAEAHGVVRIDSVVVAEKRVPAHKVGAGEKKVYDAAVSVVVGGEGKDFTVQEGGNAVLTSGRSVRLLPGTMIETGGHLMVKVTTVRKGSGTHKKSVPEKPADLITRTSKESVDIVSGYQVYPLPESESLSVSMNRVNGVLPARIQSPSGPECIFILKKSSFPSMYKPSLSMISLVRNLTSARWGERPETIRVLRT
ncbi:MAG: hypothetical protein WCI71_08940 [Bacteroidota bacterium]